jgi:hypothetical protein
VRLQALSTLTNEEPGGASEAIRIVVTGTVGTCETAGAPGTNRAASVRVRISGYVLYCI